MAYQCNWCGNTAESFIVNGEYKHFCRYQTPGHPPTKDCLTDYINEKKKQKESLFSQKKKQLQEEEETLIDKTSAIKKLDELKQFLSKKKPNHPS